MNKKIGIMLMGLCLMGGRAWAIDKAAFADHIRKALNETNELPIEISDPKPSLVGNLLEVDIRIGTFDQKVYLTPDEKKYFWGTVFDLTVDPDAERVQMLDLKRAFSKGYGRAPVTIVEFSDFQCPYCKKAHAMLDEELYKNYSRNDVRYLYKHFPLSNHNWAFNGAVAAQCAGEQSNDAFWGMVDHLFTNSESITPENLNEKVLEYAGQLKLNKRRLTNCTQSEAAKKRVQENHQEGVKVGVRATPTFFVNGRMLRGFRDFNSIKPLIDEKLKEAKKN